MAVDETDLRLIRCLQDNPRATYSSISRITDVSETTVKRRIEALFASGVISTAVFPNPRRLGYDTQAIVGLDVDPNKLDDITSALRKMKEVAFVSVTLGRFDVAIYLVVPTMNDLVNVVTKQIAVIPGVLDTDTIISARVSKAFANWRVPLDEINGREVTPDDGYEYDDRAAF